MILRILILVFLIGVISAFAKAQACGPISLRIILKDSKGQFIQNAKIETFDKEFNKERFPFDKDISWSEENKLYSGYQSLGGTAYGIGLRISADGFETFEKVLDFPFGYHAYLITLKAKESNEISKISKLTVIHGSISNTIGQEITMAKATAFNKKEQVVYSAVNYYGYYWLFLPKGNYDIEFAADGFKTTKIQNFKVLDSENEKTSKEQNLDVTLKSRNVEQYLNSTKNK